MNVSVQETADYVVVVIKKESASKGAVTPVMPYPYPEAMPLPTETPTVPAPGPGTQDWTAGTGPAPGQRTEGDQKFFDDILKG
ncbi:MAG: hypothetical protein IPM06_18940 [Rhizobiales bacterium]|nr:hypothetical protein [Hyphomicrobiales bacterium]